MAKPKSVERFQRLSFSSSTSKVQLEIVADDIVKKGIGLSREGLLVDLSREVDMYKIQLHLDVPERINLVDVSDKITFGERLVLANAVDILRRLVEAGEV